MSKFTYQPPEFHGQLKSGGWRFYFKDSLWTATALAFTLFTPPLPFPVSCLHLSCTHTHMHPQAPCGIISKRGYTKEVVTHPLNESLS
jgi:hypothetical protein